MVRIVVFSVELLSFQYNTIPTDTPATTPEVSTLRASAAPTTAAPAPVPTPAPAPAASPFARLDPSDIDIDSFRQFCKKYADDHPDMIAPEVPVEGAEEEERMRMQVCALSPPNALLLGHTDCPQTIHHSYTLTLSNILLLLFAITMTSSGRQKLACGHSSSSNSTSANHANG